MNLSVCIERLKLFIYIISCVMPLSNFTNIVPDIKYKKCTVKLHVKYLWQNT